MDRTWQEVMQELADDLEAEISERYPPNTRHYATQNRRYNRDMLIVNEARMLLKQDEETQNVPKSK